MPYMCHQVRISVQDRNVLRFVWCDGDYVIHYSVCMAVHLFHCPGALLVSILTSNKTWRTRNAVRSSNGDCEKTAQNFAMMSASDFFVGYMRSSMVS